MSKFKKGDIVGKNDSVGVVTHVIDDKITLMLEDGNVCEFLEDTLELADEYDTEYFIGALKENNQMINANGDVVRWMPKVGETYYQVTVEYYSITNGSLTNIFLEKKLCQVKLDGLKIDCFSSKRLALESI